MDKPKLNTALGALDLTQQGRPPIRFDGVTARVFPLKANMNRLNAFCDAYLNVAGDIVRFRPAFPYVLLMALDYGKMSAEVENLGWVSQHEVAFAVPLEWYRWEQDRWVFVDFATVCPFIFVDNDMSLTTGREVYGWPKVKVWLEPEVNPWMYNPHDSAHLLSMSTMVYPELYAGKRQEPAVILQIRQQTPSQFTQFPLDLRNGFNPLQSASKMVTGYMNLMGQFMEVFTNLPLMGYGPASAPPPWLNLIMQGPRYLNPLSPPPSTNQITLKQFRDAEHPGKVCYQAIVNSEMRLKRYNSGGMLGDLNLMGGDPTGGFEVLMRRYAAYPIIESLGIEVGREAVFEGAALACAQPVFPFWLNVDLEYGIGEAVCWRTRSSPWYVGEALPEQASATDEEKPKHPFNTVLGAGAQQVTGPFEFPNATVRVLPLLADKARLNDFCEKYLNEEGLGKDRICDFKPWGSYVYLVVTNFGEMSSKTNDIGWWAERELTFFVPVKWYDRNGTLLSVALIPAFSFADSETAAISGREVGGQPIITAVIKSPPSAWLTDSGPTEENQGLLTLETLLLPALHLGQRAESRFLLDITQQDVLRYNDDVNWRMIADGWLQDLKRDLKRQSEIASRHKKEFDVVRALALEILGNGQPVSTVTLKQFRDVSAPECACYQALVRGGRVIDRIYDIREIEQRVHLRIRRTPSLAIADILGLKAKWTETTGAGIIDFFQPVRPFWMRLSLSEDLGKNVCSRVGAKWLQEARDEPLEMYFQIPDPTGVGCDLVGMMRQRLRKTVQEWRALPDAKLLTREQARASVEQVEPHMVIQSILSLEWEQWGNPRWYQNMQAQKDVKRYGGAPAALIPDKPDFCIPCHSIGEGTTCLNEFGTQDTGAWWSPGIDVEVKEGEDLTDTLKRVTASLFGSIWKPSARPNPEDAKGSASANKETAPSGGKPGGSKLS